MNSIKWMGYEADDGVIYATRVDESNGELTGFVDVTDESTFPVLPKGLQMRYVIAREPASGATRKLWVGSPSNGVFTGLTETVLLTLLGPTGTAAALTAFTIFRQVGEQLSRPVGIDTGLTDGDAS